MSENFGEELSLEEVLTDILSDGERAHMRFLTSRSGENFGPELSLDEVLDLLHATSLPPRALFWENNRRVVLEAINNSEVSLEIGEYVFKIEYLARISSVKKFDFGTPMRYIQFYPNGKGQNDSEGSDRNSGTTGSPSDTDV